MKLDLLVLSNFRQYYGDQTIRFASDPVRNVTVINGNNGAGKTGLLYALNWCLYGEKAFEGSIGELTNKRALAEAPPSSEVETKVQVRFRHAGIRYFATRTLTQVKVDQNSWRAVGKSQFTLMRIRATGTAEQLMNPDAQIETMLPSNVRTYFFFDGEKIDRFAAPGHEEDVKQAIRNVLQIEVLERAKKHLDEVAKEYQKELKALSSGRLQDLLSQDESLRSQLELTKEKLANLVKEESAAKRLLEELNNRIIEVKAVQELGARRKLLENNRTAKESDYDQCQLEIKELVSQGYIGLAGRVCAEASAALEHKRKHGQIPSGVREVFIKDLLDRLECVCGRPFHTHSKEYDHLENLLKKAVPSALEDLVSRTTSDLVLVLSKGQTFSTDLGHKLEKRKLLEEDFERIHDQLEEINAKLKDSPLEEVIALENKRDEVSLRKDDLVDQVARLRNKQDDLQPQLPALQKQLEKEKHQETKAQDVLTRFTLARQAADTVENIFEDFAASMRDGIQKEAREIFQSLISKATQFTDIRLTDDYKLDVVDRWGYPARPEMSAGERQVLSLSFIAGMSRISGMEAPLVMDTPFGRLHSVHRENIVERLPELSGQLTLFVQDEELRGTARKKLESRIGVEYNLEFDHTTGCTRVVEVTQ